MLLVGMKNGTATQEKFVSLKNQTCNHPMAQQLYSGPFIQKNENLCSHKNLYRKVYGSFIHN